MSDGSSDTPSEHGPVEPVTEAPKPAAEPAFHYVVVQEGYGHPLGARIEDPDVIAELKTASWAGRVPVPSKEV